jgi:hypothetical protein
MNSGLNLCLFLIDRNSKSSHFDCAELQNHIRLPAALSFTQSTRSLGLSLREDWSADPAHYFLALHKCSTLDRFNARFKSHSHEALRLIRHAPRYCITRVWWRVLHYDQVVESEMEPSYSFC